VEQAVDQRSAAASAVAEHHRCSAKQDHLVLDPLVNFSLSSVDYASAASHYLQVAVPGKVRADHHQKKSKEGFIKEKAAAKKK
jgi:hypothetical protein